MLTSVDEEEADEELILFTNYNRNKVKKQTSNSYENKEMKIISQSWESIETCCIIIVIIIIVL